MLMSKRVCSNKKVENKITASFPVSIATVRDVIWLTLLLRWNQSFYVCSLTLYLGENFSTTLTTAIWIEAQSTWSTHRPRCTCKFFRLLIKDGYTYICRTLQCLHMKLNGGSRVHRWRTHRYLWVIRNTTETDINHVLLCQKKYFMFWSKEPRCYWY